MAFVLKLDRDPGAELARVMRLEVDSALHLLAVTPRDAGAFRAAIHDARRALRRCRAALRLLPSDLAIDTLVRPLRAAGRALSPLRDAQALLETLAQLQQQQPALLGSAHPVLLQRLMRQVRAGERRHVDGVHAATVALRTLATTLAGWRPEVTHAQLWRGLRRGTL
ncbi:CHAD domain-containing protein, partial [Metallibacterium sp.]|uniref:CHAD domain-containing protein n=1 Tax=Metallibacterium sp. TaxID=2940281 RepID=UPI002630E20A